MALCAFQTSSQNDDMFQFLYLNPVAALHVKLISCSVSGNLNFQGKGEKTIATKRKTDTVNSKWRSGNCKSLAKNDLKREGNNGRYSFHLKETARKNLMVEMETKVDFLYK